MSGDVGCVVVLKGSLVGVLVSFRVTISASWSMSRPPRASSVCEVSHVESCKVRKDAVRMKRSTPTPMQMSSRSQIQLCCC